MLRSNSVSIRLCSLPFLLFVLTPVTFGQVNITTERYDQSRLGANLSETQLNTTNVNVNTFGKLWSYTVSGSVYAQPLYIQGVNIPGKGTRNVLYVVTMNDVVYGFEFQCAARDLGPDDTSPRFRACPNHRHCRPESEHRGQYWH